MLFFEWRRIYEKNEEADQYRSCTCRLSACWPGAQEAEAEMVRMLPHQAEKAAMWKKTGEIHWNLRMITVTVIFRR